MISKAFSIKTDFVLFDENNRISIEHSDPELFDRLKNQNQDFKLISYFEFDQDWETWEIHPMGDEVLILLSGNIEIVFEQSGRVVLENFGDYAVVPQGTWHTAKVMEPSGVMVFTPGTQTRNKPITQPP